MMLGGLMSPNKKTTVFSCVSAENAVLLQSKCDSGSVGRALASQAEGRGFESRLSLRKGFSLAQCQ